MEWSGKQYLNRLALHYDEPTLNEVLRRSGIFFFFQSALNDAPRDDGGKENSSGIRNAIKTATGNSRYHTSPAARSVR